MAKLVWRVKLVADLRPGVTTETEVARIKRDGQARLAELRLWLTENWIQTRAHTERSAIYNLGQTMR